jgi:hypothetical protein
VALAGMVTSVVTVFLSGGDVWWGSPGGQPLRPADAMVATNCF